MSSVLDELLRSQGRRSWRYPSSGSGSGGASVNGASEDAVAGVVGDEAAVSASMGPAVSGK